MKYRIVHRTTYKYKHPVSLGNHIAYLIPRSLPQHRCVWSDVCITPSPQTRTHRIDYFGNQVILFSIQQAHRELLVEARSEVHVDELKRSSSDSPSWEAAVRTLCIDNSPEVLGAHQFVFESPRIRPSKEFAEYAARSFTPGRNLRDAVIDFTARIHTDFHFDSKATNVRTPPEEVFRRRRGVCQDFAHLQIACLRSLNLAARYVSGYLRTYPPPGQPRLAGADASHAWVSVYCPGTGWIDVDPTNNLVVSTGHVTLAWGRDYGDVSPLRGLILGGRDHSLKVAVDMEPIEP